MRGLPGVGGEGSCQASKPATLGGWPDLELMSVYCRRQRLQGSHCSFVGVGLKVSGTGERTEDLGPLGGALCFPVPEAQHSSGLSAFSGPPSPVTGRALGVPWGHL